MKGLAWLVLLCFVLSGCATYSAARLPSSDVTSFNNFQDQDGLKVAVKFFDARESKKVFGVDKVHEVCQPAYIIIDNRTKASYEVKKSMLSKQSIPAEEVAKQCGFSTVGRATTYGVLGLFVWPFLIPAVVDGVGSAQANQRMQDDYMYKEIKDDRVQPNGLLNGVVFFDKMKDGEELTIRLRNVDTSEIKLFSFVK
ncbi:MAG: hypothetical protein PHI59_05515 [Candidatus Omnitrophica bacterium]|nr:hypothetical protein [Candidatus Omnitrophota bacterium]